MDVRGGDVHLFPSLCYGMAKNYGCANVDTVIEVLLDKVFVVK